MNYRTIATVAISLALSGSALGQATTQPTFATRKVDGTDNVYIYRYMGHQAMFIVTPKGVIATDPIARYRPQAATTYLDEIKKVTNQPVKYVIYSHAHYDHIAGAKPFKDAGARIVAHKNAKTRFEALKKAGALLDSVVIPDETVDTKKTITLGGTTLELSYVGRNHSDSSLVMRLPKEKLIFAVDFIPIEGVQFRNIPDNASPLEYEEFDQEGGGDGFRTHDPRPPRPWWAARHQEGRAGPSRLHAGPVRGGEEGGGGRQMHRQRDDRDQAAEVREVGQLRALPADEHRALLLLVEQRVLRVGFTTSA